LCCVNFPVNLSIALFFLSGRDQVLLVLKYAQVFSINFVKGGMPSEGEGTAAIFYSTQSWKKKFGGYVNEKHEVYDPYCIIAFSIHGICF